MTHCKEGGKLFRSELQIRRSNYAEECIYLDISKWKCCKRKQCFLAMKPGYFKAQRKRFMLMSQAERKQSLIQMLRFVNQSNKTRKKFFFDGLPVCANFLEIRLGISRFLQCAVKETPRSNGSRSIVRMPVLCARQTSRDCIRCYLETIAESTANRMPDLDELHLPYFEKKQVYDQFKAHWKERDGNGNILPIPTYAYFITVWKTYCEKIKCRRVHRFSNCDICEKLRQELADAGMNRGIPRFIPASFYRTDKLRAMQATHHRFIEMERIQYYKNHNEARKSPFKYASIIIDGASQSGFELPHWPLETKATQRGQKIGVHLTGILEHSSPNMLMLFAMTGEHKTGANHVIEAMHRWLSKKLMERKLPEVLYVQVDNCSRENKNRYFFPYIECQISSGVFTEIHVSFLPVGHTHEDIDQASSCLSKRLRTNSAVTLQDLLNELSNSYTPRPHICHMMNIINLSELFEATNCLVKLPPFSHLRFFRFSRDAGEPGSIFEKFRTTVSVKESSDSQWLPFHSKKAGGFLKFTPDIFSAPSTVTYPPDNFLEVCRGLAAAEPRIADETKMEELEMLRDRIYTPRTDGMHWNRFLSPESGSLSEDTGRSTNVPDESGAQDDDDEQTVINNHYAANDLIAVQTDITECPFWLALITETVANSDGEIHSLEIIWLEALGCTKDPFQSKYRTAMLGPSCEWRSAISVNTVLARLTSLRRDKRITVDDSKRIRESLSTCTVTPSSGL